MKITAMMRKRVIYYWSLLVKGWGQTGAAYQRRIENRFNAPARSFTISQLSAEVS